MSRRARRCFLCLKPIDEEHYVELVTDLRLSLVVAVGRECYYRARGGKINLKLYERPGR